MPGRGICLPGVPVIGNVSSGSSGGGADLTDIDMTAERTDPRLIFECLSPHAVMAADGTIKFAAANEWPVEYQNGIAVGRHEPEPQSTNYMLNTSTPEGINRAAAAGGTLSAERLGEKGIPTARYTFYTPTMAAACYSLIGGNTTVGAGDVVYSVFVRATEPDSQIVMYADSQEYTPYDIVTNLQRLRIKTSASYETRYSWCGLRNLAATLTVEIAGYQVEPGNFATSPILTGETAVTRAGALAWVLNPKQAASAARIYYTDGTTLDVDFSGAERVAIPASAADWGTRYIEGVSYAKGFSK